MTQNEVARVQAYLRQLFGNPHISVVPPTKAGQPVEVRVRDEFIAVVHRDEEDGDVSYDLHMTILAEDLPAAGPVKGA